MDRPREVEELVGKPLGDIEAKVYGVKHVRKRIIETMMDSAIAEEHTVKEINDLADKLTDAALGEAIRLIFNCRFVDSEIVEFRQQMVDGSVHWVKLG